MEKVIAYCGIKCHECPAFLATVNNDLEEKRKISETWSTEEYPLKPEDVECYGCTSTKKILSFCGDCDIRECGIKQKVETCATCKDYTCDKLNKVFDRNPEAKNTLDMIKNS